MGKGALAGLAEDLSSVPSIPTKQLTMAVNCSSRRSDSVWPPQAPAHMCYTHINMHIHMHMQKQFKVILYIVSSRPSWET